MKLTKLYESVGHWRTIDSPYHVDPKHRKSNSKNDLSFRIKGKKKINKKKKDDPKGGDDRTQSLETGAGPVAPRGYKKASEIGMKTKGKDIRAGSDMGRLHGNGRVAGGELKAWSGKKYKGIRSK